AKLDHERLLFNPGTQTLADNCDIIIQTGTPPVPTYNFRRQATRVLVIHGFNGSIFTENYAKHAPLYDEIVTVSESGIYTAPKSERKRIKLIPNALPESKIKIRTPKEDLLKRWNLPLGKKILLFLGRISI